MVSRNLIWRDPYEGVTPVALNGPWNPEMQSDINSIENVELILDTNLGWSVTDMSFLDRLETVARLRIVSSQELLQLNLPPNLASLDLMAPVVRSVAFQSCPNLNKIIIGRWSDFLISIFNCTKLLKITIVGFPYSDLSCMSKMSSLEELHLIQGKVKNLEGIANLSNLNLLELSYCKFLVNICPLADAKKLQVLHIEGCKKIQSYNDLALNKKLQHLTIDKAGKIETVAMLKDLQELKTLSLIETIVSDGNLGCLLDCHKLAKIYFQNRKHYSHTSKEWHKIKFPNAVWTQ